MPVRTNAVNVAQVIDVPATEPLSLDIYITTANAMVNSVCLESDYSTELLELIERWLAAHCYACNRRRTLQNSVGGGAVMQQFDKIQVDLMLNNTIYGQHAMVLDWKGNLAALINKLKDIKTGAVQIHWLGQAECSGV